MKRYTARIICESTAPDGLRHALSRGLARTILECTLEAIDEVEPGVLLAELASDAKPDALLAALRSLEPDLGCRVEKVGWGWLLSKEPASSPADAIVDFSDPLLTVQPQEEASKDYPFNARPVLLYLAQLAVPLSISLWFLIDTAHRDDIWWVLPIAYLASPFLFPRNRIAFSRVSGVSCGVDGLEVRYWLGSARRTFRWSEVWGLDLRLAIGSSTVWSDHGRVRFPRLPLANPAGGLVLATTIVERASLQFVEALPTRSATYRRFDAV